MALGIAGFVVVLLPWRVVNGRARLQTQSFQTSDAFGAGGGHCRYPGNEPHLYRPTA